ncbi:MAG: DinB family protein [Gemmatimonadales bacterium]
MRTLIVTATLALAAALPVSAQHEEHHDPNWPLSDVAKLQSQYYGWSIKAAEQMPEADFAFKPTPEVRSFGEIAGHLANANYAFCAAAKGEKSPQTANYEKATGKAAIVAGMKAAQEYCDQALKSIPHERSMAEVTLFGMKGTVNWVMAFNLAHNSEHYGNLVTYMRMKGMVPPSSQGN